MVNLENGGNDDDFENQDAQQQKNTHSLHREILESGGTIERR